MDERERNTVARFGKLWPSLPFLATGLSLAWNDIAFSGAGWLSATESNGANITLLYLYFNGTFALACLAVALLPRRFRLPLIRPRVVRIAGITAAFGALLIILAGPFYLDAVLPFNIGCALMGVSSMVIMLFCASAYSQLAPRQLLLYLALAQIAEVFVYQLNMCAPPGLAVEGGPSLASIVICIGLPLLTAFFATIPSPAAPFTMQKNPQLPEANGTITRGFVAILAVFFLLAFVSSTININAISQSNPADTLISTNITTLLRIPVALTFIYIAISPRLASLDVVKVIWVFMLLLAMSFVGLALLSAAGGIWQQLNNICYTVAGLMNWCILSLVVYQRHTSVVRTFGLGQGLFLAGCVTGCYWGVNVLPNLLQIVSPAEFFGATAVVVLLVAVLMMIFIDSNALFAPASQEEETLEEMMQQRIIMPQICTEDESESPAERRPFRTAMEQVAAAHQLTQRETEIFVMLARGLTVNAIAEQLCLSRNTVRTHAHAVYSKLGVHSREELMKDARLRYNAEKSFV
ncbi:hypothetical protein AAY81_09755 [Denitrobacterium detoxificans]|uniref:Regulatory protein, luxR family n=1 Tax=Denitrobacterium detoxificans TaxID=79604 RepID=A0A172S009_9ACTN|nr:LuxR C-terminal-related transcriptional regulator [Denitrobacterium detoxificans]ANE23331.1 hypothetical protein AAY81_09755 [Denitrobacterium detoxificans]SEO40651.1 regulatory protein, luxR family [Denitrobacterium detoxificans]